MTAPKLILRANKLGDPDIFSGWVIAERFDDDGDTYFVETVGMRGSDVSDAEAAINNDERERLITEAIAKRKAAP